MTLRTDGLTATLVELSRQLGAWVGLFHAAGTLRRATRRAGWTPIPSTTSRSRPTRCCSAESGAELASFASRAELWAAPRFAGG